MTPRLAAETGDTLSDAPSDTPSDAPGQPTEERTGTSPLSQASLTQLNAFEEGTITIPLRGEQATVRKEAVVTGEVVITKERTVERQEVTDTVRIQRVIVEDE